MDNNLINGVFFMFKNVCVVSAISMTIYCAYEYSKNEDTTTVSYKTFNEDEQSPYPQFTLCLFDFSPEIELSNELGHELQFSLKLLNFYLGNEWDDRMLDIDMNKVASRINEYLIDTCVKGPQDENHENKCEGKGVASTFLTHAGCKCLSFHYRTPMIIDTATIWIKTSTVFALRAFSFPQQLINPNTRLWDMTISSNSSTKFELREIEVNRHRNKIRKPCHDWKSYDYLGTKHLISSIGCRPFYAYHLHFNMERHFLDKFPNCTTKEQNKRIHQMFESRSKFGSPCIELRKLHTDSYSWKADVIMENNEYPGIGEKLNNVNSWIRVTIRFPENTYKDIQQTRAYTVQSFIGNSGGYFGLFVGCAIYDLPSLWMVAYRAISRFLSA